VVVAQGEAISPLDLPPRIRAANKGEVESPPAAPAAAPASAPARRPTGTLKSRVEKFERDALIEALREANDNQSEAARLLETPLRTIQHKISAFGIKRTVGHRAGGEDD
jgi:transcriptional regulator with GAF, ATPase, and Fis domain